MFSRVCCFDSSSGWVWDVDVEDNVEIEEGRGGGSLVLGGGRGRDCGFEGSLEVLLFEVLDLGLGEGLEVSLMRFPGFFLVGMVEG